MRDELVNACLHALHMNLGLAKRERVLIVTDQRKRSIGERFQAAALTLTDNVDLVEIPIAAFNGAEPPAVVAEQMKQSEVVLLPLSKSISWTRARMNATQEGARIASMPGITGEIILRTFTADYEVVRRHVNGFCNRLDEASRVRVTSELGTEFFLGIKGRKGRGRRGGIYTEPGAWGNLPCGEAFIAPLEGTSRGRYVVDGAQGGVGALEAPITVTVEEGRALKLEGGHEAKLLRELLKSVENEDAFNIAEFGIGCNDTASASGITLEAEKARGTCHIALGSNHLFGGTVKVNVHLDGVITTPSIWFDDIQVVDCGRWVIDLETGREGK